MACEKFIGLVRVSTERQGKSRLGLESGHAELARYADSIGAKLLTVLEEVESGGHDDIIDRPTLLKALTLCKRQGACLLIPRVDRLVRSTCVYTDIKRSGVKVRFVDNPHATEVIIDIQVALSADTKRKISETTRNALAAYKAGNRVSKRLMVVLNERYHGDVPQEAIDAVAGKLGAALVGSHLTAEGRDKGRAKVNARKAKEAVEVYDDLIPLMKQWKAEGASLQAIADRLNESGERTRMGAEWSGVQVMRTLKRATAEV